jgi:hypothetical protein
VGCPQGTAGPPGLSVLGGRMEPGAGGHATRGLVGGGVVVIGGNGGDGAVFGARAAGEPGFVCSVCQWWIISRMARLSSFTPR